MEAKSPRLNYDVLDNIAAHSTRETVLTLMRTCKLLYKYNVKHLLHHLKDIDIDTEKPQESVQPFLCFMARGQGRRWHFVRALRFVGKGSLSPDIARQLPGAFGSATKLKSLVLHHADHFLGLHNGIAPALASLTAVEVFRATFVWRRTLSLIQTAQWRLRTADVSFQNQSEREGKAPEGVHPAALFSVASPILTELVYKRQDNYGQWLPSYPVYPNVRLLTISWDGHDAQVSSWVRTYPNVTSLQTFAPAVCHCARDHYSIETINNFHAGNFALNDRPGEPSWRKLERYSSCCLVNLHILALPYRIRRIELKRITKWEVSMLSNIMSRARPEELLIGDLPSVYLSTLRTIIKPDGHILEDLRLLDVTATGKPKALMKCIHAALVRPSKYLR